MPGWMSDIRSYFMGFLSQSPFAQIMLSLTQCGIFISPSLGTASSTARMDSMWRRDGEGEMPRWRGRSRCGLEPATEAPPCEKNSVKVNQGIIIPVTQYIYIYYTIYTWYTVYL